MARYKHDIHFQALPRCLMRRSAVLVFLRPGGGARAVESNYERWAWKNCEGSRLLRGLSAVFCFEGILWVCWVE